MTTAKKGVLLGYSMKIVIQWGELNFGVKGLKIWWWWGFSWLGDEQIWAGGGKSRPYPPSS